MKTSNELIYKVFEHLPYKSLLKLHEHCNEIYRDHVAKVKNRSKIVYIHLKIV